MKTHKLFRAVSALVALVMLLALSGCAAAPSTQSSSPASTGASASTGDSTASTTPKTLEVIHINSELGSLRNTVQVLAHELGYYEEEGIDAKFQALGGGIDSINAVAIGKTNVQLNGVYQTLSHISQGTDVVIFAGTAAEGSTAIARPEDVERLKDLKNWKGVKVAHTRFNNADFVTRGKVREAGVDIDKDVEYIAFDDTTLVVQAVGKGTADVAVVTNESLEMAKSLGLEVVFSVGEIAPMYVCCRHTGSKTELAENRQTYVNLLIAELRAYKVYREEQERVIEIMTELSRAEEEYVYNYLYSPESSSPLTLDPSLNKLKDLYALLEEWGYVQPGVKVEDSVDITIYKDALDEVIRRYPDDPLYKELLEDYTENNT